MIFKKYEIIPDYLNIKDIKGNLKKQVDIVSNIHLYVGVVEYTLRSCLLYFIFILTNILLTIFSFYFMIISDNVIIYILTLSCSIWYLFVSIMLMVTDFKYFYLEREIYLKRKVN